MQLFLVSYMALGPAVCTSWLLQDNIRSYSISGHFKAVHEFLARWWCRKIWYLSLCYAIVQFGITAVVYFNPFIVGEQETRLHQLVHGMTL